MSIIKAPDITIGASDHHLVILNYVREIIK